MRILVSGMVAGDPRQGGATWSVLQYVLGLRRLGHDVWLVEPVADLRDDVVRYFRAVVTEFALADRAALLERPTGRTVGPSHHELVRAATGADLLLNVSGMLDDGAVSEGPAVRAYLDLDPAFNQFWDAEGIDVGFDRHERFVTVGLSLGEPDCPVPTAGREWIPTLPPVVLERWPSAPVDPGAPVTTVGNWRGYGSVEADGVFYGQKAHSMRELLSVARDARLHHLLALAIHPDETADLEALREHGWQLADPGDVAGSPQAYADFVRASSAELGLAKSGYVRARCGWFSDRSACYLASGRPVVAQDTGFSRHLPTGSGLLCFADADQAVAGFETLRGDHAGHAGAAREIAEAHLDSDLVLTRLLEALT